MFASIQTLSRADLALLASDHFDVVIVDEFHHAAAETYATLLRWLEPKELLGLTATPERADGRDVLGWFDGRITAELRLWDAIDQRRLVPFVYYGLSDGTDLRHVPFRRGQGYDVEGLTNVYTANDIYAGVVLDHLVAHVDDPGTMRALGFCVSVAHAQFMARVFNEAGVASRAVWGGTPSDEREAALQALVDGDVKVLFSVDLFNEGVDLPNVDTLLLLRPTESATLFLQQLGRGLRKATGKAACLVLDMVGHHRQEFRFDLRLKALLRGTRKELEQQVEQGFPFLPAGCHLELDRVVQEVVLRSLRSAIPSSQPARVAELRTLLGRGGDVGLGDYLAATGLAVDDVYSGTHGWSDLLQAAGGAVRPPGPHEQVLRRAVGRLLHVDDPVRTACYLRLLRADAPPEVADLDLSERRLVRMLVGSLCEGLFRAGGLDRDASLQQAVTLVWAHGQVVAELAELFEVLAASGDHLVLPLEASPDLPLGVHARYTRLEILSAFGAPDGARIAKWQTGVRWVPEEQADLLAFTLDKTSGAFSPTTRYRDHAISRDLIHWESQSVVREGSDTGQRYQHHAGRGSSVHLFCRLRQDDRAFWYLGPATYVSHEGERPMAVTWRLDVPLPGDLFTEFAAAVA